MKLRRLELRDSEKMLSWMHDESVVQDLRVDYSSKTIFDCRMFIQDSWTDENNLHLAIVDDRDEYLGTVSLKNIHDGVAEFAIAVRKEVMGSGVSKDAMKEMLRLGFMDKGLNRIFWCVSPNNRRAIRFYDKNNYKKIAADKLPRGSIGYSEKEIRMFVWYMAEK